MTSIACCQGEFDQGVPEGTEGKLGTTDCYYPLRAEGSASPTTAIIIVTDVFGWKVSNARLLADRLSKEPGVLSVIPDYFDGKAANPVCVEDVEVLLGGVPTAGIFAKIYAVSRVLYYIVPFMITNSHASSTLKMRECIASLRQAHPSIKHIALAGYCWGGHVAVKLSHDTSLGLGAVYSAHGGQLKVPQDYDLIRVPACIVHAGNDFEVAPSPFASSTLVLLHLSLSRTC